MHENKKSHNNSGEVVHTDKAMAYEFIKKLNGLTLWLLIASAVAGFFIKNQGLFSAEFGSGLLRELSFDLTRPERMGGLTLLTSFFVHFNLPHLLGNFMVLLPFGAYLERTYSKKQFAMILAASHIFVLGCQWVLFNFTLKVGAINGNEVQQVDGGRYLLGASAAAYAVLVLALLKFGRFKLLGFLVIIMSFYSLSDPSFFKSHLSHAFGVIFGLIFFFIEKKLKQKKEL